MLFLYTQVIEEGAHVNVNDNSAQLGAGILVESPGTSMTVTGEGTQLICEWNICDPHHGGGMILQTSSSFNVENGALVKVSNNVGHNSAGGILAEDQVQILVTGANSKLILESNTAQKQFVAEGGGLEMSKASTLSIVHGAALEVRDNIACNGGGIALREHSTFIVEGIGSQFTLEGNIARGCGLDEEKSNAGGGGLLARNSDVSFREGSEIIIQNNTASTDCPGGASNGSKVGDKVDDRGVACAVRPLPLLAGGGMSLFHGSSLIVRGDVFHMLNNIAQEGSGGGLAVYSRSTARIETSSSGDILFRGNAAPTGDGGAIAFVSKDVEYENGGPSCVNVKLYVEAKVSEAFYPFDGPDRKPRIRVYTEPQSVLDNDDWKVLVNSTGWHDGKQMTRFCLPCGEYTLKAEVNQRQGLTHGGKGLVRLMRDTPDALVLAETREGNYGILVQSRYPPQEFSLRCEDQGVSIRNARFETNQAKNGGALGMTADRKNSFFLVKTSIFAGNTAGSALSAGKGGAAFVSGINSGIFLDKNCVLLSNAALGGGLGGALYAENNAGVRIHSATSKGNIASGGGSLGGFLFAVSASPILVQSTSIEDSEATGGGEAVPVS